MTEPNASEPIATPVEKASVFDDLVEIMFAPTQVFARRKTAGFGVALVILWVLISGVALASRSIYEPAMQAEMAKSRAKATQNQNLTEDQLKMAEKVGGYAATGAAVVGPPIAMLMLGVFVWLFGKPFGSTVNFGQGMLIATYSYVPRFLGSLVLLGLSFVMDMTKATSMAQLSLGPARFVDPAQVGPIVLVLLSRIDVAVLWATAIVAIGYASLGNLEKGKAWAAAFVLWLAGAIPVLLGAMQAAK